jgi:zinc protease
MKHLLATLVLCVSHLAAQAQLSLVRTLDGISEYSLPNGLQVLLLPDATKPVASVNITYRVGSRHESAGETGSAHLLEHLLFKASGKVTNPKQVMGAMGMRFNGTTSYDRTNYFASFLTSDEQATQRMDTMLGWLAGMMTQAKFTRADLDSEMTVVRNEFERAENEPGRVLGERMRSAAFSFHGYRHSVLGAKSDVENVPLEALYAFYRKHYRPDNATLIVAGRFDEAAVKASVTTEFAAIAKPAAALPVTYTLDPVQDGERSVILRRVGGLASTAVLYHLPAGGTREGAAARLLTEALRQRGGPLARGLVAQQLAVTEWASYAATREPGFMTVGVGLAEKAEGVSDAQYGIQAYACAAALAKVVETYQPTDAEVQTARSSLLANVRTMRRDAEATAQGLSEMVALGDWRLLLGLHEAVQSVTPDEVRALARSYLVASNRTAGTYLPVAADSAAQLARAPDLSTPNATQLIAVYAPPLRANAQKPENFGNAAATPTPPAPGALVQADSYDITYPALVQRTQRGQLTVAGAPGLKLAVLPRAVKDDRVTGTLRLRWGTAETVKGSGALAPMIAPLLMEGTSALNGAQIKERLQALDARINFSSFSGALNANLEFPAVNTEAVLELLSQLLKDSQFAKPAFDRTQRAMLASMQNLKADTASLAANALDRSYRPKSLYAEGDPREVRAFEESEALIKQAGADALRAYWQRFGSAQVGELVLTGPLALAPVQMQLQTLWATWASQEPHVPWVAEYAQPQTDRASVLAIADKANASYLGRIAVAMNLNDADYPALFLGVQILSRQGLWQRVREREGLSYSVTSNLSAPVQGNGATIDISASFAPQNAARLRTAIREVLLEKREQGFSSFEVGFAKSAIVSRRAELRAQSANTVGEIANNLRFDRPLDFGARFDNAYRQLDAAAINAALKKHLNPDRLWEVVVGSFKD